MRAYRVAQPGQVVEVAGGTYPSQTLTADASKTSSSDVVFRPAAGATVTIQPGPSASLSIQGADHLEFDNMTGDSWETLEGTDDVTIRNLTVHIFWIKGASNINVIGGSVGPYQNGASQIKDGSSSQDTHDVLIDGVLFHDYVNTVGVGMHMECLHILPVLSGSIYNLTIRKSKFVNCGVMDVFHDGARVHDVLYENNYFDMPNSGPTQQPSGSTYPLYISAKGQGALTNITVRYNTFNGTLNFDNADPKTNVAVYANIGTRRADQCTTGVTFSYNIWDQATCGTGDILAAPSFTNISYPNEDFHLTATAAAINHGSPAYCPATDIDGDARPRGTACDAGADEAG